MRDLWLVVGFQIHEGEEFAVVVEIFDVGGIEAHILHALAGIEGLFGGGAAAQVTDGDADGRFAAAGLMVGELQHLVEFTALGESRAFAELVDVNHGPEC